jgi:hypothetical protein
MGIGINTGEAIIGEMGSSIRSDYTIEFCLRQQKPQPFFLNFLTFNL